MAAPHRDPDGVNNMLQGKWVAQFDMPITYHFQENKPNELQLNIKGLPQVP